MRDIKFRGFNNATQAWYYMIIENQGSIRFECSNPQLTNILTPLKQLTNWQQYTGLKDKNGKEIYEGDILNEKSTEYTEYTGQVVFDGGGFRFKYTNRETKQLGHSKCKNLLRHEIIGNIHENPELIGDKQ